MGRLVIGLTGGIGSGKTAVSDHFQSLGITVVDADQAARVVVEPGQPALVKIHKHFGDLVIKQDGSLDRAGLREIVFKDAAERKWLEDLLHPLIHQQISKELAESSSAYTILVSPLLVETRQADFTQRILVVDTTQEKQIERTMLRDNNSEQQVRNIVSAQTSREARLASADDVIINDSDLDSLYEKVDALHKKYLALAESHG